MDAESTPTKAAAAAAVAEAVQRTPNKLMSLRESSHTVEPGPLSGLSNPPTREEIEGPRHRQADHFF